MTRKKTPSVEGPRNPERSEFGAYLAFLSRCYGFKDPRWFGKYAPHFYNDAPSRLADKWVLGSGHRFVSHVGVFPFRSLVDGRPLKVAGIGGVATDPAFRGRGHMRSLLEFVDRRMREEEYALSVLWGDRWRYNRFGYERALVQNLFVFSKRFFRADPGGPRARASAPCDRAELFRLFNRHPFRCRRTPPEHRRILARHMEGSPTKVWVLGKRTGLSAYAVFFHGRDPEDWTMAEWGGDEKDVMTLVGAFLRRPDVAKVTASFPGGGRLFREASLVCDTMSRTTLGGMIKVLDLGRVLKAFEVQMRRRYTEDPLRQSGEWSLSLEGEEPVTLSAERELSVQPGRAVKNHVVLKPLDATRLLFGDAPPAEPISKDEATRRFLGALFPLEWYWWRSDRI